MCPRGVLVKVQEAGHTVTSPEVAILEMHAGELFAFFVALDPSLPMVCAELEGLL